MTVLVTCSTAAARLAPQVKAAMMQLKDPRLRACAESDDSEGQPDDTRLARAYAREVMGKIG